MRKLLFLIPLLIVLATCHEEEKVEEPTLNAEELLTSVFELFGYRRNHTRPHIIPPKNRSKPFHPRKNDTNRTHPWKPHPWKPYPWRPNKTHPIFPPFHPRNKTNGTNVTLTSFLQDGIVKFIDYFFPRNGTNGTRPHP